MTAFILCIVASWRTVLLAIAVSVAFFVCERILEQIVIDASLGNEVRMSLLPDVLALTRMMLLGCVGVLFGTVLGAAISAYRVYRILYPKFIRGGPNAIALYWLTTKYHSGCPAAGFEVAAFLASMK